MSANGGGHKDHNGVGRLWATDAVGTIDNVAVDAGVSGTELAIKMCRDVESRQA